jgi:LAO/AO transport system kinase
MPVSALEGAGLAEAWAAMADLAGWRRDHGHWAARRAEQARGWFEDEVRQRLLARLATAPARARLADLGRAVAEGRAEPAEAAARMLDALDAPPQSP